jgi:hypothetical protein
MEKSLELYDRAKHIGRDMDAADRRSSVEPKEATHEIVEIHDETKRKAASSGRRS